MADISDNNAALNTKIVGADATGIEQTPVQSTTAGAIHTNLRNNTGTEVGTIANPLVTNATVTGDLSSSYSPDPSDYVIDESRLQLDFSGNLKIRGNVLSDEGSYRDDFTTALAIVLSGNVKFVNGSTTVDGTGAASFTTQVKVGDYIKGNGAADSAYGQVDYIVSDSLMYLTEPYTGANVNAAGAQVSRWKPFTAGTGTASAATSNLTITSGTTTTTTSGVIRAGDYLPYTFLAKLNISQRIANQAIYLGFTDTNITANQSKRAQFVFDGTTNTTVKCVSASSSAAADTQTTTVTLPTGTTATSATYEIGVTGNRATFLINGTIVATHSDHLAGPYDNLSIALFVENTAAVTNTTIICDYIYFSNVDQLEIANNFSGEPIRILDSSLNKATYSSAVVAYSPPANPTDIFTITGSASRTIRISNITVSGTQTTGAVRDFLLIKRSTANTGGTSATLTAVPHDSLNSAATATVRTYSVLPTLGTIVGNIRAVKLFVPPTTAAPGAQWWNFADNSSQGIVLRGANEVLALNFNASTSTGGNYDISIEWTEE